MGGWRGEKLVCCAFDDILGEGGNASVSACVRVCKYGLMGMTGRNRRGFECCAREGKGRPSAPGRRPSVS